MLATFLDGIVDHSPYSPVSRQLWNEALVDPQRCPGAAQLPSSATGAWHAAGVPADPAAPWDPYAHWQALRPVVQELAGHAWADHGLRARMHTWMADNPDVAAYAGFRAGVDRLGTSWHNWSDADHRRARGGDLDDPAARMWLYAQWSVATQMHHLTEAMTARDQLLYCDLALGAHGDGFDTWQAPQSFGWGVSVGAPPDELFTGGQNWGFPPVLAHVASASGHDYLAACLRAHLQVCGVLRLDHVMGFQRLFWIPDGAPASQGMYVAQPMDEMLAVLSVEASRSGAVVIGENLGTVDPGVEHAMQRHRLYGMYVGQFEVPATGDDSMATPSADELASLNTHDTPTFAGWLDGDDIDRRASMGLLDADGVEAARLVRTAQVARLHAELEAAGLVAGDSPVDITGSSGDGRRAAVIGLLSGFVQLLGASPAPAVLVSIDDLVAAVEPQNVPGTPAQRPNWVVRLPEGLPQLAADPTVAAVLDALNRSRIG
jgi:4-alpha-glucanotransferase